MTKQFIDNFINALSRDGYEPAKPITDATSGVVWPRLRYEGEKKPSGRFYLWIEGDRASASYGSDKDPMGFKTWVSWEGQSLSNEDLKAAKAWQKKKDDELARMRAVEQERVKGEVLEVWKGADKPTPDHDYALMKGLIRLDGVRLYKRNIVVPIINTDTGQLESLQYISDRGAKWFHTGGAINGNCLPLKEPSEPMDEIYICEGYSTGMTIRQVMAKPVIVAFNAGNMKAVTEKARVKYPDAKIIIAGDNDQFPSDNWPTNKKWVNTGEQSSIKASAKTQGIIKIPDFEEVDFEEKPTDWNDYYRLYGDNSLKLELSCLNLVTTPAPEPAPIAENVGSGVSVTAPEAYDINENNWLSPIGIKRKDNRPEGVWDTKFSDHNAILMFKYDPLWAGMFVFDEFRQQEVIVKPLPWEKVEGFKARQIEQYDLTEIKSRIRARNINISSDTELRNILNVVSRHKTIHPVRETFKRMEWDGQPRLDDWLIDYAQAVSQPKKYIQAVSKCFLLAAVKRILNAGEPFHHMLVLEGSQSAGKSSLLKALATFGHQNYFSDALSFANIGNPNLAQFLRGNLLFEFAELSGMSNKDRNVIKSFMTQTHDEILPKYSNIVEKWPRQFVMAGSTNDSDWLNDPTGGRRFWPVKVGKIDVAGFNLVKEQIWAEAVYRAEQGEPHFINVDDPIYKLAQLEQVDRFDGHVWQDVVMSYVEGKDSVSIDEVLTKAINKPKERWNKNDKRDIAEILRAEGWENKTIWDVSIKKNVRRWCRNN